MTKEEFRQALKRNGINCDEFSELVGRDVNTIYDFGVRYPVPYYARIVLRLLDERGGAHGLLPKTTGNTEKTTGNPGFH